MEPILKKSYARDFSLPLIQTWSQAEVIDPRQWTDGVQPIWPYTLFVRKDGLVHVYVDERGIEWIKEQLRERIQEEGFVTQTIATYRHYATPLKEVYASSRILGVNDTLTYITALRTCWVWHEAVWFLVEVLNELKHPDFDHAREALVEYQGLIPDSDRVIRRALKALYPYLADHTAGLLIEEIGTEYIPTKGDLQKRLNGYLYAVDTLYVGEGIDEAEVRFGVTLEQDELPLKKELHGESVFPGVARGTVCKILVPEDINKLEPGQIVVTSMTLPESMRALKSAVGIVTDEGGITRHIAFVAEKLKKPAVMNTRVATQVFHDGDQIEVNADTGVVTLLN